MTRYTVGTPDSIWPTKHRKLHMAVRQVNLLVNLGHHEIYIADTLSGYHMTVSDTVTYSQLQEALHTEDWRTK